MALETEFQIDSYPPPLFGGFRSRQIHYDQTMHIMPYGWGGARWSASLCCADPPAHAASCVHHAHARRSWRYTGGAPKSQWSPGPAACRVYAAFMPPLAAGAHVPCPAYAPWRVARLPRMRVL